MCSTTTTLIRVVRVIELLCALPSGGMFGFGGDVLTVTGICTTEFHPYGSGSQLLPF